MPLIECVPERQRGTPRRRHRRARRRDRRAGRAPARSVIRSVAQPHRLHICRRAGATAGSRAAAVRRGRRVDRPALARRRASPYRRRRRRAVRSAATTPRWSECVALAKSTAAPWSPNDSGVPGLPVRGGGDQRRAPEPLGNPARRPQRARASHEAAGVAARLRTRTARIRPPGATAIGARPILIAYNVNLATNRLSVAKRIASAIRDQQWRPRLTSRRWACSSSIAASCRCR